MSRVMSASKVSGRYYSNSNHLPKPGTSLRALFDFFHAHRGRIVHVRRNQWFYGAVPYLRDFYGQDIRSMGLRHKGGIVGSVSLGWCLVGEWSQSGDYIDYVALRNENNKS